MLIDFLRGSIKVLAGLLVTLLLLVVTADMFSSPWPVFGPHPFIGPSEAQKWACWALVLVNLGWWDYCLGGLRALGATTAEGAK